MNGGVCCVACLVPDATHATVGHTSDSQSLLTHEQRGMRMWGVGRGWLVRARAVPVWRGSAAQGCGVKFMRHDGPLSVTVSTAWLAYRL